MIELAFFSPISLVLIGVGLLLSYLFPQKVQGPRAGNLKVSTAKYGEPLARVYGRARVAGRPIWLKGNKVDEHASTETVGGFFGTGIGGTQVTSYRYTSQSAYAFTHHEIEDIPRLWIDGQLVYDNTEEALTGMLSGSGTLFSGSTPGVRFTLYRGTPNQRPDPRIVADRGADTPAYRNTSYIVFESLDHTGLEIGVRLPEVEAEIVTAAAESFIFGNYQTTIGGATDFTVASDYHPDLGLVANAFTGGTIHVWRKQTRELLWAFDVTGRDGVDNPKGPVLDGVGHLLVADDADIVVYDAYTSQLLQTFTGILAGFNGAEDAHSVQGVDSLTGASYVFYYRGHPTGQGAFLIRLAGLWAGFSVTVDGPTTLQDLAGSMNAMTLEGQTGPLDSSVWLAAAGGQLWRIGPGLNVPTATLTQFDLSGFIADQIEGVVYSAADDSLILADSGNDRLVKVSAADPTTVLATLPGVIGGRMYLFSRRGPARDGLIAVADRAVPLQLRLIDAASLQILEQFDMTDWTEPITLYDDALYDPDLRSVLLLTAEASRPARRVLYLPRVPDGRIPLASIYDAECRSVDLIPDVSAITETVIGYAIRDETTPRGVIEDLDRVKSVDWAQIDGVLTFFPRGETPEKTIPLEDAGASMGKPGTDQVREDSGDPYDLPESVILEYIDYDALYRIGAQEVTFPLDHDIAGGPLKFTSNLVMQADEAAQSADRILQESRDIAHTYEGRFLPRHLDLHPASVVTLTLDDGRPIPAVMTEMKADMVIEGSFHRRLYDYSSDAVGVPAPNTGEVGVVVAPALFLPLDIPILADADDSGSFYWALWTPQFGGFASAEVYRSLDDAQTFAFWASHNLRAGVGALRSALPAEKPWRWNRTGAIDITLLSGSLHASKAWDQLQSTDNLFAIMTPDGWEIVQAATVTQVSGNHWRLSVYNRGRRGTENYMSGHAIGDLVVALDGNIARAVDEGTAEALFAVKTQGVAIAGSVTAFQNDRASLRPYAPSPVFGNRDGSSGDLDLSWRRRTRLEAEWDGDPAALGEDSEEYEVDIVEGTVLLRTITGLTSPQATYTLAQYNADTGGSAAEIPALEIQVFQISAQVGRGETIAKVI